MSKLKDEFMNCFPQDARLTRRAQKIAQSIADNPCLSINAACGSAAESKAAYRFFQNQSVNPEKILKSHIDNTLERSQSYSNLLILHDTTDLIYSGYPSISNLGEVQRKSGYASSVKGLMLHNSLLLSESGVPLGILKQSFFTNEDYRKKKKSKDINVKGAHKNVAIEQKKSHRWIEHLIETDKTLKRQGLEAVHVADRECDIFEFIQEAIESHCDFVIRSHPNRRILEATEEKPTSTIQAKLDSQDSSAEIKIFKDGLWTYCDVKYVEVEVVKPQRLPDAHSSELLNQDINVVEVKNKPGENISIHWRLLTNLDVDAVEDALRVINIYKQRWSIECFHRVLKSGFGVEKARLTNRDRIENLASLLSVISWHIFWIYNFGRTIPDAKAEVIFSEQQIKVLKISAKKLRVPTKGCLSTQKAIFIMARLGGFLGRKSDGEPGMQSIWRGWQKLMERLAILEEMGYG